MKSANIIKLDLDKEHSNIPSNLKKDYKDSSIDRDLEELNEKKNI